MHPNARLVDSFSCSFRVGAPVCPAGSIMRALLSLPFAYEIFRRAIAGHDLNETLVKSYLRPNDSDRILDVGCGPASILAQLPPAVTYVGFDPSPSYISAAIRRYGKRGTFLRGLATRERMKELGSFDLVLCVGVLHHLDDGEVIELSSAAASVLRPGGRLVTLDGCFHDKQSRISRFLLQRDRGRFVRERAQYRQLVSRHFSVIEDDLRTDLLRIPYSHLIMQCTRA